LALLKTVENVKGQRFSGHNHVSSRRLNSYEGSTT